MLAVVAGQRTVTLWNCRGTVGRCGDGASLAAMAGPTKPTEPTGGGAR